MIFDSEKRLAAPGLQGVCPTCSAPLHPKCGRIVTWHWAHVSGADCDPWAEHESPWHIYWKQRFPPECVESRIERNGVRHRADVIGRLGTVIELQHCSINGAEIEERETFYGRMVWLFDAVEPYENERLTIDQEDGYVTFRWKHARKGVAFSRRERFLDMGRQILWVKKIYSDGRCGGWGRLLTHEEFVARYWPGPHVHLLVPGSVR